MRSILDFEKNKKEAESKNKREVSNASLSIDQVLSQLDILINENEELNGIFFLKNRSALMLDNPIAYIANFKGNNAYNEKLIDQKIRYNDFPRWKNIAKNDDIAEIDILTTNSKEPFLFQEDKSFLISAVREGKYNWGMLVAFAPKGKVWTTNQLKLIKSFSKLLCSALHFSHQQEKEAFLKHNSIAKENKRTLIIEKLEERLEKKNQIIDKLKKGGNKSPLAASFNWSEDKSTTTDEFDEVWVTVHGYKNGEIEPSVSRWEKVTDSKLLKKVSDLFFQKSDNNQAQAV